MNLDDFHVQVHLWPLLGLHRPTPALIHAFLDHMAVIKHHRKSRKKLGPATGWPTPCSADSGMAPLYLTGCTGSPWHSLARVPIVSLHALPSSALFALVSLQVHKKKKKKISLFCILICISFAFRVYLLLFARTCLWWYYYPARTVLWCVIAHKNDFVECYNPQE